jgi:hypothetical protein
MPFVLVIIGAIIIVAAIRNTQGNLASALEQDVPNYLLWALAIVAVGGLGYVPGMRQISRWLLALVLVVLVLRNYKNLLSGFSAQAIASGPIVQAPTTPGQAAAASPAGQITTAEITGTGSANINANAQAASVSSPFGAFDPAAFLASYEQGYGGFGGVA